MPYTLSPPPEVVASWPEPNYVNPETRGEGLFIVTIVLSAIGILVVAARLYSRLFLTKAPGFDDVLVVFALAFGLALSALVIIGNKVWFSGHHIWDIPLDKYVGHRLNIWIAQWLYVSSLSCVKVSVLLFYRRLSVTFSRGFMIATWVGIIYNIAYWASFSLALLLLCRPVSAYWNKFDPQWVANNDYTCGSEQIAQPVSGSLSVLGDFYSALLPMLLIMSLELPRRQKYSLYGLFAIAFLVVGAGIARTVLVNIVINVDYDFTWILWEMWIWGLVELYVALLAASAPALKPFVRRYLVDPMSSAVDSGKKKGSGYGDRYGDRVEMTGKGYGKDFESDPERIGVAYGGSDMMKSREESFVREIDDDGLETKHFELRQSRDGKKMIPTQIWGRANQTPSVTDEWALLPIDSNRRHYPVEQKAQHARNFSSPHSYKSSGDTTASLIPHRHIVSQILAEQRTSDPQTLGQAHAMDKLSEGSVKAARLRAKQAQQQQPPQQRHPHIPISQGIDRPDPPRTNSRGGNQPSNPSQPPLQRSLSAQRELLRHPQYRNSARDSSGRGSRLDPPSSGSSDESSGNSFDEPHNTPEMYVVQTPSAISTAGADPKEHSRSTSEETLHLPRMGSREDFGIQAHRQRELEEHRRRDLIELRRQEEEQQERERTMSRKWRKEGTIRR